MNQSAEVKRKKQTGKQKRSKYAKELSAISKTAKAGVDTATHLNHKHDNRSAASLVLEKMNLKIQSLHFGKEVAKKVLKKAREAYAKALKQKSPKLAALHVANSAVNAAVSIEHSIKIKILSLKDKQ